MNVNISSNVMQNSYIYITKAYTSIFCGSNKSCVFLCWLYDFMAQMNGFVKEHCWSSNFLSSVKKNN